MPQLFQTSAITTVSLIPASLVKSCSATTKSSLSRKLLEPLTRVSLDLQDGLIGLQEGHDSKALLSLKKAFNGLTHAVREIAYPAKTPERESRVQSFFDTYPIDIDNINGLIDGINTKKAFTLALVFKSFDFQVPNPNPYTSRIINAALSKLSVTSNEDREFILEKAKEFSADLEKISLKKIMEEIGIHFCLAYKGLYEKDCSEICLSSLYDNKSYRDWVTELREIGNAIQDNGHAVANGRAISLFSTNPDDRSNKTLFIDADRLFSLDISTAKDNLGTILDFEQLEFNPSLLLYLILESKDNLALAEIERVSDVVGAAIETYEKLGGVPPELSLNDDKNILNGLRNGILTKKAIILASVFGRQTLEKLDDISGAKADFDTVCEKLGCRNEIEKSYLRNRGVSIVSRLDMNVNIWRFFQVFREAFDVFKSDDTPSLTLFEGREINDWVDDLRSELGEKKYLSSVIRNVHCFREEIARIPRPVSSGRSTVFKSSKLKPNRSSGEIVKVLKIPRDKFLAKSSAFFSDNCETNRELLKACKEIAYPEDRNIVVELYGEDTVSKAEPVLVFLSACRDCSESGKNVIKINDLVKRVNNFVEGNPFSREEVIGLLNQTSSMLVENSIRTDIDFGEKTGVDKAISLASEKVIASRPFSYEEFLQGILELEDEKIGNLKIGREELRRRLAKVYINEHTYPYFSLAKAYERVFLSPGFGEKELTLHRLGNEIYPVPGITYVIEVELKGTELDDLTSSENIDRINKTRRAFIEFLSENPHLHNLQITEQINSTLASPSARKTLPPLPTLQEAREFWALLQLLD